MDVDFEFNDNKIIYLSLAYQAENPLYLKMKLSFFSKETLNDPRHNMYLLLLYDLP